MKKVILFFAMLSFTIINASALEFSGTCTNTPGTNLADGVSPGAPAITNTIE